jgi:hypothetical protein
LPKPPYNGNHFFVFIGLQVRKEKNSNKIYLDDNHVCLIIEAINFEKIAYKLEPLDQATQGFWLDQKVLLFLKSAAIKISKRKVWTNLINITTFMEKLIKYQNIIMTIEDFENRFHEKK